ncbi:hypothetical protein MUB24_09655 [Lederbergia sp. NSJ-179]|uniref:hypothetical protein n=1 Tax=Lederbergia sp. NSJ-179 TaxID=2931402 RepID=UPI001FD3CB42|nr:hypothetical protein [Lederbergia sp. NSJ-179]MCJ7841155.1 hypothetical protein [Lederbergia sp. NSJ-179]
MNIKDYYSGMSRLYIHQSILCVFVLFVIVFPALHITSFASTTAAGILLFFLLIYYVLRHIYFSYKSHQLPNPSIFNGEGETLLMLEPSPVTAYQGKLFSGSGFCHFSIKKGKRKAVSLFVKEKLFTITDHRKNTYWSARINHHRIQLMKAGDTSAFKAIKVDRREYGTTNGEIYRIVKSAYTFAIKKNGKTLMFVSRGLMPFSMQRIFSASTPIIKFDRQAREEERIFCLLIYFVH